MSEASVPSTMKGRPLVAIMTDFGTVDGDVGVMKGVIAGIVPAVHIIDVTHEVAPQNIASGAWILASGYRYYPEDTVFICVVDPGVGSTRGAIAVHAGPWFFVGPDNGLFTYIYNEQPVRTAVRLNNPAFHLPQVSSTFHGRDIFAPAGAHLARGVALRELGEPVDPRALQRLPAVLAERENGHIAARIVHVDHFGNLITNIPLQLVPALFVSPHVHIAFSASGAIVDQRRRFFAEGAEGAGRVDDRRPFIFADSSGYVGIAVRNGSAARALGSGVGAAIIMVTQDN
jgi:S-adenosyl-L-methionine hydrolase (adenosine-forming)